MAGVGVGSGVGHGVVSLAGTGKVGVGVLRAAVGADKVTPDAGLSLDRDWMSEVDEARGERLQEVTSNPNHTSRPQRLNMSTSPPTWIPEEQDQLGCGKRACHTPNIHFKEI